MNTTLLLTSVCAPLLLALFTRLPAARRLMPLAALPALLTALTVPVGTDVSLPWLLLGSQLGLDATGRVFLGFSSLLWLLVAAYLAGARGDTLLDERVRLFFLLTMAGNFMVAVAQDMVSFYFGFALMGLSAYGLISHSGYRRVRYAARRYLAWTLVGEMLLFSAIVMLASAARGEIGFATTQTVQRPDLATALLLMGFGIKLALPLLHWWLPAVYAVTPPALLALFSGVMIKAGILGMLRFLPPGSVSDGWGMLLIGIGTLTLAFGLVAALLQRHPRLLLGYSSVSKMGVMSIGVGAALAWPVAAPGILAALLIYVVHHALAKTALFLGLDLIEQQGRHRWVFVLLLLPALALAGAPLTSGALAKTALSAGLAEQVPWLITVLTVSTFVTALLMVRFLQLAWTPARPATPVSPGAAQVIAWLLLLAIIAAFPLLPGSDGEVFSNVIPVTLALLTAPLLLAGRRWSGVSPRPPGPALYDRLGRTLVSLFRRLSDRPAGRGPDEVLRTRFDVSRIAARYTAWLRDTAPLLKSSLTAVLWLSIGGLLVSTLAIVH